jgi:hypothetical protein
MMMSQTNVTALRPLHRHQTKPPISWNEPTLDEILTDPIVKDLMAADGVNSNVVRLILLRAVSRLQAMAI